MGFFQVPGPFLEPRISFDTRPQRLSNVGRKRTARLAAVPVGDHRRSVAELVEIEEQVRRQVPGLADVVARIVPDGGGGL